MRLLLLDDDPADRLLLKRALVRSELQAQLFEAGTVGEAASLLAQIDPDCLLVDYRLPDGTGLDLLARCRCPLILLTGQGDEALAVAAMKAGAADYIPKESIAPVRLHQAISAALEKAELQARLARYQADLEQRNRDLEILNRQKDRFFSILAHDLRSPFNALLGLSQHLLDQRAHLTPAERDEFLTAIHHSVRDLYALLENLLEWARVQMMKGAQFEPTVTNLRDLVTAAIASMRTMARQKGVQVDNAVEAFLVRVDRDMIGAVLRNLLENAVKFTDTGGRVTVAATGDDGWVAVTVADTGVGMAPELVQRLFRLDEKVTTPGTGGERGTGLGLLLCKELVERHGGRISVSSRLGAGTSFRFTLPAETAEAAGGNPEGA